LNRRFLFPFGLQKVWDSLGWGLNLDVVVVISQGRFVDAGCGVDNERRLFCLSCLHLDFSLLLVLFFNIQLGHNIILDWIALFLLRWPNIYLVLDYFFLLFHLLLLFSIHVILVCAIKTIPLAFVVICWLRQVGIIFRW